MNAASGQWIEAVKSQKIDAVAPHVDMNPGRMGSFTPCPACHEAHRGRDDKRGPVGTARDRRGWKCQRCDAHGDAIDLISLHLFSRRSDEINGGEWSQLRTWCADHGLCTPPGDRPKQTSTHAMVEGLLEQQRRGRSDPAQVPTDEPAQTEDHSNSPFAWHEGLAEECAARLQTPDGVAVRDYLREGRAFNDNTVEEWGLGCIQIGGRWWLTIPLRSVSERVINVRFRSVPPADKTYRVCPGRPLPLFGSDRLGNDLAAPVLVTEGELDVIAMWQYGYTSSVVSGTAGAGAWKDDWLDTLEPYESYVLLYDDDEKGHAGAKAFAEKMGVDRCSRAILPRNDAGKCLQDGVTAESVQRCIDTAQPMFGVKMKRVDDYMGDLERLINDPKTLKGFPTGSKRLDRLIGGWRPGLIVVSGDAGHGKTTFCTWALDQLSRQGVPVLLTSFENTPLAAVQKLLRMEMRGEFLDYTPDERAESLNRIGERPIHVLDHYGHISVAQMISAVRYSARRHGVRAVLVDHLGFLVPPEADDERRAIEAIIRALSVLAYTLDVRIFLVCHPTKLPPGQRRPTMNNIKGASAIKQDASDVIVVERDPPRPKAKKPRIWPAAVIHLDKVRSEFGVALTSCRLAFGQLSMAYADEWQDTPEAIAGTLAYTPPPPKH